MKLPPSKVDHWIRGRFSREPENYKILQCALPAKPRAARFNCSSISYFAPLVAYSFMIFKMSYKTYHLRTYILVRDISTRILYSWTFSPIFILEKESRTKTMTHGRESFHKCDFKKTMFWSLSPSAAYPLDHCLQEACHRGQCSEHWWQNSHPYRMGDTESSLPGWKLLMERGLCLKLRPARRRWGPWQEHQD